MLRIRLDSLADNSGHQIFIGLLLRFIRQFRKLNI